MTDTAPERIFTLPSMVAGKGFTARQWADDVEYIRADIHATLTAERDALRAENARLVEDRARFPDRPDFVGDMIAAHIGNLKNSADSAKLFAEKYRFSRDAALQDSRKLRGALENIVEFGNPMTCVRLREIARAALNQEPSA